MSDDALEVYTGVVIPRRELLVRATRSAGPGGQHVNTSSTRIELRWSPITSTTLTDAQRARIVAALAKRIHADGTIRVVASEHRSQRRNREAAEARLAALLHRALTPRRTRIPTKPTRAAKERRLEGKRREGERKRRRREETE